MTIEKINEFWMPHYFKIGQYVSGFYWKLDKVGEQVWKSCEGIIVDDFLDGSYCIQTKNKITMVEMYDSNFMFHNTKGPIRKFCDHCNKLDDFDINAQNIEKYLWKFDYSNLKSRPTKVIPISEQVTTTFYIPKEQIIFKHPIYNPISYCRRTPK